MEKATAEACQKVNLFLLLSTIGFVFCQFRSKSLFFFLCLILKSRDAKEVVLWVFQRCRRKRLNALKTPADVSRTIGRATNGLQMCYRWECYRDIRVDDDIPVP